MALRKKMLLALASRRLQNFCWREGDQAVAAAASSPAFPVTEGDMPKGCGRPPRAEQEHALKTGAPQQFPNCFVVIRYANLLILNSIPYWPTKLEW
jgi:hypothetical protein